MKNTTVEGIYFQPQTLELLAVTAGESAPGGLWTKLSDDHRLSLLAARRELERSGLVEDSSMVQWHASSGTDANQQRRTSQLIGALQEDSDRLRREGEDTQGFRQKLASIFTSPLRSRGEET